MEILLYASATIAALSLLLIAIFSIVALKSVKKNMNDVSGTISRMESKFDGITKESTILMEKTNRIASDVEKKMNRLEGFAQSADHINETTNQLNRSFQTLSYEIENPEPKYKDFMKKTTVLTETASRIYFKIKSEKQKHKYDTYKEQKKLPYPQQPIK